MNHPSTYCEQTRMTTSITRFPLLLPVVLLVFSGARPQLWLAACVYRPQLHRDFGFR